MSPDGRPQDEEDVAAPVDPDVVVVGAGAAGLTAAIFVRLRNPALRVLLLDGARRPGAKILVSGGTRCNVTNAVVTEHDYHGGPRTIVRRVLRAFPVAETVRFFEECGVALREEPGGKLFPASNSARQVLDALLSRAAVVGVDLRAGHRVTDVAPAEDGFRIATVAGSFRTRRLVLATGGQSLPKSGSDGAGYGFARTLGHTIVPTTPALVPLVLPPSPPALHAAIPGVSLDATLTLWVDGAVAARRRGSLLWTHFGISGPVVLDMSRHLLRARLEARQAALTAAFMREADFAAAERIWLEERVARPRATVLSALARLVPASMAAALLRAVPLEPERLVSELTREHRRALVRALTEWPLPVVDSRGYNYAEATAGGVDLREVSASTLESRRRPGLYLVGEILDVDGRLGGFNFQWAWSSAYVAAAAIAGDPNLPDSDRDETEGRN